MIVLILVVIEYLKLVHDFTIYKAHIHIFHLYFHMPSESDRVDTISHTSQMQKEKQKQAQQAEVVFRITLLVSREAGT